jgi:hypothetical protein
MSNGVANPVTLQQMKKYRQIKQFGANSAGFRAIK